jgi:hypothetical protein
MEAMCINSVLQKRFQPESCVMPAQAGIQEELKSNLDSGIRRSDG